MKKLLISMLVICLVAMMGMVSFAADDKVLTTFDAADPSTFVDPNGSSAHGTVPTLAKVDGGMQVTMNDWIGTMHINDETFCNNLTNMTHAYVRVRLTVSEVALKISFTLWGDGGASLGTFNNAQAILLKMDGTAETVNAIAGGSGEANSAIEIPAGFDGYLFLPTDSYVQAPASWQKSEFVNGTSTVTNFEMDVRSSAGSVAVLGEITLTDAAEVPSGTADVSTLAMAAAAVLSCGALAVVKKRK